MSPSPIKVDRQPVLEDVEMNIGKKQCKSFCSSLDKENCEVATGS